MTDTLTHLSPEAMGREDNALAELIRDRSFTYFEHTYLESANGERRLSFRALECAVEHWLVQFEEVRLARGAAVAIAVADPIDFSAVFLAVIASGRWAAPLDPEACVRGDGGVVHALSRVQADFIVADRPLPEGSGTHGADLLGAPSLFVGFTPGRSDTTPASTGSSGPAGHGGGVVLSSSGTTGIPKVIALHQSQLLHTARHVAEHHQLSTSDRGFNPLPLFHINAEVVGLLATLVAGSSLILDDRFHRTNFWETMRNHHVTWINAVPAIIARLAEPDSDEIIPPTIRFIRSASAPLPATTMTRFEERTGIAVLETYGMTEAASQITANPLSGTRKPGSVGRPVGIELRIVPEVRPADSRPVAGGQEATGHVEIRGPSVITAYGGEEHRELIDADGWLRTGDLGHLDAEGYLHLDGRTDDVINRGGEKVFPREIEEAILADPGVAAVSVIGEPDPVLGQVPVAFLVLHGIGGASDRDMARHVVARIRRTLDSAFVRAKRPVALHVVLQLPVGATGKVQRRTLREHDVLVIYYVGTSAATT
jgi:acyl-CoA synthetase (AMP-forming)/AMP-acid ligase II